MKLISSIFPNEYFDILQGGLCSIYVVAEAQGLQPTSAASKAMSRSWIGSEVVGATGVHMGCRGATGRGISLYTTELG